MADMTIQIKTQIYTGKVENSKSYESYPTLSKTSKGKSNTTVEIIPSLWSIS